MLNVIAYTPEPDLPAEEFRALLMASTLAQRRPAHDLARLQRMLANADVVFTARHGARLVGAARAITDFAVDVDYQRQGIGTRLIEKTHKAAGLETSLFLISAPAAENYYRAIAPRLGMKLVANCWSRPRER